MKRSLALTALVAAVGLTIAVVTGGASTTPARTIHVIEHADADATADVDPLGDWPGDVLTFHNPVFNASDSLKVGRDQEGYCIRIKAPGSYECNWTTVLENGHITVEGLPAAIVLHAYFETRVRPCLLFQIERCSAPCTGEISEADYGILVDEALRFLTGESDEVKWRMHRLMDDASLKQDYERAASFRDRLTALSNVQSHQGINPETVKEADVFAAHQDAGQTAIQVFFFRTGNNWGNRAYFPRADKSLPVEEVLEILRCPIL